MRDNSNQAIAALAAAPNQGLLPRTYVTLWPWLLGGEGGKGAQVELGYWGGALNISLDVVDPDTGGLVNRDFVGGDALVGVSSIRLGTGLLQKKSVTVTLSGIHPTVLSMLAVHRLDRAPIQIHRVPLSPATRRPVSAPRTRFIGFVDDLTRPRPKANTAGSISLVCMGESIVYTRTNPEKRSHESHKRRRGADDHILQYTDVAGAWDIRWGEESGSAEGGHS